MAIRREFKSKKAMQQFKKTNKLVYARKPETVIHGTFYDTKKTPKKIRETRGTYGKPRN